MKENSEYPIFQVDAFSSTLFGGNPAAVMPLQVWPSDEWLQAVAMENNLSETAYFVENKSADAPGRYQLRWFTPSTEVKLCGHATLASAHVLFDHFGYSDDVVIFDTLSGQLSVRRDGNRLAMDFPAQPPSACEVPEAMIQALGITPSGCLACDDYIAVLDCEEAVRSLTPNMQSLEALDRRGLIVTAPSSSYDFVARFFAPKFGIPEDPVTGSAYTQLVPYWKERLGKNDFHAYQCSERGGEVFCQSAGDRIGISGTAVTFMVGSVLYSS